MFRINLLPEEARPSMGGGLRVRRGVILCLGILGIVLVSVVGTASWQARAIGKLEVQAADLRSEAERYEPQINIVKQLRSKKAAVEKRLDVILQLDRDRSLRITAMDELSSALPDYMWLTGFIESEGGVAIDGVAFSSLAVFEFMENLESMSRFEAVRLKNLKRAEIEEGKIVRFTLTTMLVGG
ncbi:MAG: PilN domain-containing protein [Candidatus Eisenbacteria sp.]|nr:PilN domain-containing protein [Candidatus Eisenbacteria bacterium]